MTQHDAKQCFDFQVDQALPGSEVATLGLYEADVFQLTGRERRNGCVDVGLAQPKAVRCPLVDTFGVFANSRVAALSDVTDDVFDGGTDFGIAANAWTCRPFLKKGS